MVDIHIPSQTPDLYHRQHHRKLKSATTATTAAPMEIILNCATIGTHIIEMKDKAALEAAKIKIKKTTTTLARIATIYFCVAT